jgi:hypothetical protein
MNFDFKLKNMAGSIEKHYGRIEKIKKSDLKYSDVIDDNFESELISQVYNATWFQYRYARVPQVVSQSLVRELKTGVNGVTRNMIRNSLKYAGFPESWDTAFYLKYKGRVDALMKRVTKQLLGYIPKKRGRK